MAKKKLKLVRRRPPSAATNVAAEEATDAVNPSSSTPGLPVPDAAASADLHVPHELKDEGRPGDIELGRLEASSSHATSGAAAAPAPSERSGDGAGAITTSDSGAGNRPRGLSLDIEDPASEPIGSADPHVPAHASGRVSPGAGPSASAMMLSSPTSKSSNTEKHGGSGDSARKKTPPTDEEDGIESSDEEEKGHKGAAGNDGLDYVVVHESQTSAMAGVEPGSRGDSAGSALGGPPLSPTHRGGDVINSKTQHDMQVRCTLTARPLP